MQYELVHEIKNLCRNNQMRDIFFNEVETDDPLEYVKRQLKGERVELMPQHQADGTVIIHASVDGLIQTFTFSPV